MDSEEGTDMSSSIGAWETAKARDAIDEAIIASISLEGLQDALTRRIAAQRLSPNTEIVCYTCGHPYGSVDVVHECSSEG